MAILVASWVAPNINQRFEDELPASIFAVMRPTLSTPAACATSITVATSAKGTLLSPLTNITCSARVLKMSVRRPCRSSHVASS